MAAPAQYSPLNDNAAVPSNGCGCFRVFGFGSNRNGDSEHETWIVRKLKKMKEVSEMVAGPRWKNLMRKMGGFLKGKKQRNRFQYDAQSYALNFDEEDDDDDHHPIAFSSRFAVPFPSKEQL